MHIVRTILILRTTFSFKRFIVIAYRVLGPTLRRGDVVVLDILSAHFVRIYLELQGVSTRARTVEQD